MKSSHSNLFLPTLLAAGLIACSGGGGDQVAGIGGSGYISTGTVTGFGSVFVNGVEFETNSATFEVEDNTGATQDDLRIGMIVQVNGSINSDGITGTATNIHYSDDLQGPITSITTYIDGSTTARTVVVLGVTAVIYGADTIFANGANFAALDTGTVIEVSGHYDDANVLQASYVELKSPSSEVEIAGTITGFSDPTFFVQGVNIDSTSAVLSNLPNGLQDDLNVEIKGSFDGINTITATEIEGSDDELTDDGSEVSVEGYITEFTSKNINFKINGQPIDASSLSLDLIPATLILENGLKVEAEGTINNGILIATEIESRSGNAEVTALVESVDTTNNLLTVNVVATQTPVTIQLTTATLTEDELGLEQVTINDLLESVGVDFVEVRGYESSPGTITATRLKRIVGEKTELQGVITSKIDNTSITVLGVEFPVDLDTEYSDELEAPFTDYTDFISNVTLDQTVISIEDSLVSDKNIPGIADAVEIETP